jgi:hypothetical protein
MKTFLLSLLLASGAFAQTTFPIQVGSDPSVSVTVSNEAATSVTSMITTTGAVTQAGAAIPATTLLANATNSQTTFQVASIAGVTTCMGITTGTELSAITGISGTQAPYTLTVSRGAMGTTKAAYSAGQAVSFTQWGNVSCFVAAAFVQSMYSSMTNHPGPLVAAQQAAIVTATAAIASIVAAGITHAP